MRLLIVNFTGRFNYMPQMHQLYVIFIKVKLQECGAMDEHLLKVAIILPVDKKKRNMFS